MVQTIISAPVGIRLSEINDPSGRFAKGRGKTEAQRGQGWRKGRGHADPAPITSARSAGSFWTLERAFQKSDFWQKGVEDRKNPGTSRKNQAFLRLENTLLQNF